MPVPKVTKCPRWGRARALLRVGPKMNWGLRVELTPSLFFSAVESSFLRAKSKWDWKTLVW